MAHTMKLSPAPIYVGRAAAVFLAIVVLGVASQLSISLPGAAVPQTAQTLAVVTVGGILGPRWGAIAVAGYLVAGALGLPVFAGGGSGTEKLLGPSGGYLGAFVLAAAFVGWWVRRRPHSAPWQAVAGALLGHAVILLLGWARLAFSIGPASAYTSGVGPFLVGAFVKSTIAGAVIWWCRSRKQKAAAVN